MLYRGCFTKREENDSSGRNGVDEIAHLLLHVRRHDIRGGVVKTGLAFDNPRGVLAAGLPRRILRPRPHRLTVPRYATHAHPLLSLESGLPLEHWRWYTLLKSAKSSHRAETVLFSAQQNQANLIRARLREIAPAPSRNELIDQCALTICASMDCGSSSKLSSWSSITIGSSSTSMSSTL